MMKSTGPITPKPVDVLLGRGRGSIKWKGNIAFANMILAYVPAYVAAKSNKDKIFVTVEILSLVKDNGGRFLALDVPTGELYEVSDAEARIKVSQALRHRRGTLKKEASKSTPSANSSKLSPKKKQVQAERQKKPTKSKSSKKTRPIASEKPVAAVNEFHVSNGPSIFSFEQLGEVLGESRSQWFMDMDDLSELSLLEIESDDFWL